MAAGARLLKIFAAMYRKILVALDTTPSDQSLLPAVSSLASLLKAELLLVHVADGWVARNFDQLNLVESEEMKEDWQYLEERAAELRANTGLTVSTRRLATSGAAGCEGMSLGSGRVDHSR